MRGASEPAPDHMALRDLDPDLAEAIYDEGLAELVVIDGRVTNEVARFGSAEDENLPEVDTSNELLPDMETADEAIRDRDVLDETVPEVSSAERVPVADEVEIIQSHEGCSNIDSPLARRESNSKEEAF